MDELADGVVVLVLDGLPAPMAEELEAFAGESGRPVALPGAGAPLRTACRDASEMVLHASHGRTHFASNAPDRNALFLYETLIVVGIPVTLVSAVAWKYFAETVVSGDLTVQPCDEEVAETTYAESFRLRSEGRGFVRTEPLREAHLDAALRGLARQLLEQAIYDPRREP